MSNATRAGVSVNIEGQEYELCPPTFEDLEWLENCAKRTAIENGRKSLPEDLEEAEREEMLRIVVSEANKINIIGDGIEYIGSIAGGSRIIWRMLQRKHSYVLLETVQRWLQISEIAAELNPIIKLLLFGNTTPEKSESNGEVKKGAQKKVRRR